MSGDITQDRAPEIRDYLMNDLSVEEIDPETITRKLSLIFLEEQADGWIPETPMNSSMDSQQSSECSPDHFIGTKAYLCH